VVLCAAPVGQPAHEDGAKGHGLLTACVMDGLVGRADMDLDHRVDARELLIYVGYRIIEMGADIGVTQQAWQQGRTAGDGLLLGNVHPRLRAQGRSVRRYLWPPDARRPVAVSNERYYIDYQPIDDLKLESFDKVRQNEPVYVQGATFDQDASTPIHEGFHVPRAGELLAVVLARQLQHMGLVTGLEIRPALLERLRRDFPAVDTTPFRARLRVTGSVLFTVRHRLDHITFHTDAQLDTYVRIHGDVHGSEVGVFQKPIRVHSHQTGKTETGQGYRALTVSRQAIRQWVTALLRDPDLQPSLINYLRRVR